MFRKYFKNTCIALLLLSYTAITVPMQQPQSWWQKVASYFSLNNDARLLKKYKIPSELEAQLNDAAENDKAFKQEISKRPYFVCKCPNNLPCYIKGYNWNWNERKNISRIENLENLEKAKNKSAPDDIMLPTKFLWHQKNRGYELNDFNYFIVSEELKQATEKNLHGIDSDQLHKVCNFLIMSKFMDVGSGNMFFSYDHPGKEFWKKDYKPVYGTKKRVAIIDTEGQNFEDNSSALYRLTYTIDPKAPVHPIILSYYNAAKAKEHQKLEKSIRQKNNFEKMLAFGFGN